MLRLMRMCVWNSMRVWISYRSFWQKWNFISCDQISCKHYPKWNAYKCPSKYWVVLKRSWNETSCEQKVFSRRFEISNRYEFISPHVNVLWVTTETTTSITWTRTLDPEPGPRTRTLKTWTLKNLDPGKPGPWKTSTLKNLDPEKPGPWKTWETTGYGKMIRRIL